MAPTPTYGRALEYGLVARGPDFRWNVSRAPHERVAEPLFDLAGRDVIFNRAPEDRPTHRALARVWGMTLAAEHDSARVSAADCRRVERPSPRGRAAGRANHPVRAGRRHGACSAPAASYLIEADTVTPGSVFTSRSLSGD